MVMVVVMEGGMRRRRRGEERLGEGGVEGRYSCGMSRVT